MFLTHMLLLSFCGMPLGFDPLEIVQEREVYWVLTDSNDHCRPHSGRKRWPLQTTWGWLALTQVLRGQRSVLIWLQEPSWPSLEQKTNTNKSIALKLYCPNCLRYVIKAMIIQLQRCQRERIAHVRKLQQHKYPLPLLQNSNWLGNCATRIVEQLCNCSCTQIYHSKSLCTAHKGSQCSIWVRLAISCVYFGDGNCLQGKNCAE